jgi:hypothetical protein
MHEFKVWDFEGAFPLWLIGKNVYTSSAQELFADNWLSIEVASVIALAVYTDRDLAERAMREANLEQTGASLVGFEDPWAMLRMLKAAPAAVFVTFDPDIRGGRARTPFPRSDFIRAIARGAS